MRLVLQGKNLKFRNQEGKEGERIRFYCHEFTHILPVGTKMWVPKFDSQDNDKVLHAVVTLAGYEVNFGSDGTNPVTEAILETEPQEDVGWVVTIKAPWELRNSCID